MYTREKIIKIFQRIGINEKSYIILREQKKKQKKSMAEIVCNLILEKYGKQ